MSVWGWIYDHAPTPVQQWLDNREMDRMADEQYRQYLDRMDAEQKASEDKEAEQRFEVEEDENVDGISYVKNSDAVRLPYDTTEISYSICKSGDGYHYAINEWPAFGPDREGAWSQAFATQEEAEREANAVMARETEDADLERLEHEQSIAAGAWSGDRGAELERLERSEQTHGERSTDEPPERGIEDDEEELER